MKKENVLKTCYSCLRRVTPLDFDCGRLCGGKCCKGDEKTGMLLFPGEEMLIDENMQIIEAENGMKLAVCSGSCRRDKRPLACRIYPLFPLLVEDGSGERIEVVYDLRADCPLGEGEYEFDKAFIRGVRRVGKYLMLNEEAKDHLKRLSEEIVQISELKEKFLR